MSTTSYVGAHFLHSLRSAGVSSPKFESSVPWLPNKWTCDENSSTISCTKPKTLSCWLLRSSIKFDVCLYGLEAISEYVKEERKRRTMFKRW